MLKRLFPWKYLLKLAARRYDIIDPLSVAARIRSFAQPSEVQEPIELLRAGIIFHARGLLNTKAIQHNLDWVWPYWVERQFNPQDTSFIPRAFSFSHINLTHRNWTALGVPDIPVYPIVDPRGLVTPLHDGWSIDCWFMDDNGAVSCPSRLASVKQHLVDNNDRRIVTTSQTDILTLKVEVFTKMNDDGPVLELRARVNSTLDGWLIFSLRPCNPEGVQFIESAGIIEDGRGWLVNEETVVRLSQKPKKILFSDYQAGDVLFHLGEEQTTSSMSCRIGMVTSAALYRIKACESFKEHRCSVALPAADAYPDKKVSRSWSEAESGAARLRTPDAHIQFLHDTAVRSLIHLTAGDAVPGPYTYNRFWFRDACIMLNALLNTGLSGRCGKHLETFTERQTREGFFHSQDGEWDSNGQVLWLMNRYRLLSGKTLDQKWLSAIVKGGRWIANKRDLSTEDPKLRGLLPAGFSAEHFGPNDNYYWDDFWAIAGLYGAAETFSAHGMPKEELFARDTAFDMEKAVLSSIGIAAKELGSLAIPTSPNRRLDSGAIGVIVADYPLQLLPPGDARMLATADYLMDNCLQKGCFFQDMIHSGINIYMTLELAQVYLRSGDKRYRDLLRAAASLASPTGQWPEAIHPITGGGCMGDGQHGWAIAEWIMLIRNMFVMEEGEKLLLGKGVLPEWLKTREKISYGPTLTPFGSVEVLINNKSGQPTIKILTRWYNKRPESIIADLPGFKPAHLLEPDYICTLEREEV